jgi:hypothetical protein
MSWRNLLGTLTEDGAETLAQQISKLPEGSSVVEVGRDGGRETLLIAETIKNSGKHIKFFSVGLDKDAGELHETINFCGVGRFVKVIDDDPVEVADLFESDSVDFLFVHPTTKDAMFEWVWSWGEKVNTAGAVAGKWELDSPIIVKATWGGKFFRPGAEKQVWICPAYSKF